MDKQWKDYEDANGLVVQKNGDGGDSLNRTAVRIFLSRLTEHKLLLLASLDYYKYRRNTHLNKWYADWDRTSRDQLIPLVIVMGLLNPASLTLIFIDHLKRGLLFAYNTRRNFQYSRLELQHRYSTPDVDWDYSWKVPDLTGPEFWALYIRGFNAWYLYPLLCLFDLETLVGSFLTRRQTSKDDVINHAVVLEYGRIRLDTPVMWLARLVTPRALLQERLDTFFGKLQEPPINELFRTYSQNGAQL